LILTQRILNPIPVGEDPASSSKQASAHHVPSLLSGDEALLAWLYPALDYLESSRPTAVNLQEGMDRIRAVAKSHKSSSSGPSEELAKKLVEVCQAIEKEDLQRCKEMSRIGAEWLVEKIKKEKGKDKLKVMTVCNTGSLATSVSYLRVLNPGPRILLISIFILSYL
jgi:methylthioribose-1-phosphate isomerase